MGYVEIQPNTIPMNPYCTRDFFSFWAAGKMFLEGADPYNTRLFDSAAAEAGCPVFFNFAVANPPWSGPILAILGLFNFRYAAAAWIVLNFVFFFAALRFSLSIEPSRNRISSPGRAVFIAMIAAFFPAYYTIYIGQLSLFVLFCYSLFLRLYQSSRYFAAGLVLAGTAVKPQLAFISYIILALWVCLRRDIAGARHAIGGFASAFLSLNVLAFLLNPVSYRTYLGSISPHLWHTPTISAWLRSIFPGREWIIFAPSCIIVLYICARAARAKNPSRVLVDSLAAGLCAAPYLWTSDFTVLLPVLVFLAASASALSMVLFLANVALILGPNDMRYAVWYPVLVFGLTLAPGRHLTHDQ